MNSTGNEPFSWHDLEEDILIRKLLIIHDPDGRYLDSEMLLRATENILCYASASEVPGICFDAVAEGVNGSIEIFESQELLGHAICKILNEMQRKRSGQENLHARTMTLFDLLSNYGWDAKLALLLAAFATSYGKFLLIIQLYPCNTLAVSVAMLRQFPSDLSMLKPRLRALSSLVKQMVEVTKCIIKFEGMRFGPVKLEEEVMAIPKSYMYIAAYLVARSALACASQITDLIAMKHEQVHVPSLHSGYSSLPFIPLSSKLMQSNSAVTATWELSSLLYRLTTIFGRLRQQVDLCLQLSETKMYQKLIKLFQEAQADNQEVLGMLFASKYNLPLKHSSSQEKLSVSELRDKVVLLLVSKPKLLSLEGLLLLVQQTYDHPDNKGCYEVVWLPVLLSGKWTNAYNELFSFLSDSLPWYSVWKPWTISTAIVNYIKQVWNYQGDPLMVVLDPQGAVTNLNALDMVLIWGGTAYPFSTSKEEELWEKENWTMQLLVDGIDALLTRWVEEGRNICLYGGDSLDWIREFNAKVKVIRRAGVQLEMVYVGRRNLTDHVKHVLAIINSEMRGNLLSFTKLHFFWLRLESMRRSRIRSQQIGDSDHILEEVTALLDNNDKGWAIMGRGSTQDIVNFQGSKALDLLEKYQEWGPNVTKLGLLGALRAALEPTSLAGPCNHSYVTAYAEGLMEGVVLCNKCKHPMKKYIIYE